MTENKEQSTTLTERVREFININLTNLSDSHKKQFLNFCLRDNLDPFKREAHASLVGNTLNCVTGYEVYIKRGAETGNLDGFEVEYKKEENDDYSATITIYRKDWKHPLKHTVLLAEYAKKRKSGELTFFWQNMPKTMLTKVAISQGFRLAFPEKLGGMAYTIEELDDGERNGGKSDSRAEVKEIRHQLNESLRGERQQEGALPLTKEDNELYRLHSQKIANALNCESLTLRLKEVNESVQEGLLKKMIKKLIKKRAEFFGFAWNAETQAFENNEGEKRGTSLF